MPYEESFRTCPTCRRATWHGRDVPVTYRSYWLAVFSHLKTVYSDWFIRWKCLECGRKGRSRLVTFPVQKSGSPERGPG